jgi:hypothetical protein
MPDNVNSTGGPAPDREQSSGNNNRCRNQRNQTPRESTFKGRCEDLNDALYDVTTGKETFLKTTRTIAEYISHTYKDAGEFRLAMITQVLPTLVEPPFPVAPLGAQAGAGPNFMDIERWKIDIKEHITKSKARESNSQRIYGLVLGQCSPAIRSRMEAHQEWIAADAASNVMGLLEIIQQCMTLRQTRQHAIHSLFDAEALVLKYTQGRTTSNHDYFEKFKDNVSTAERLGSEIGMQSRRVEAILEDIAIDLLNPTDEEVKRARTKAKDGYMATCFLMNSDRKRYGSLIRDIENEHTRGTNSYPTSLTEAYDYLVNYKGGRPNSNDTDEGGLSFYNDGNSYNGGRGGRGGRNGGRGGRGGDGRGAAGRGDAARGGGRNGGGRGQGRGRGGQGDAEEHANDDAQFLIEAVNADNLDNNVEEYFSFQQTSGRAGLRDTLLLDSCSSINLICNKELLHDIYTVDAAMHVRCNAGVKSTNQKGYLGEFPEAVWLNPDGAANILSLNSVKKHYSVRYDSSHDDAFIVSNDKGQTKGKTSDSRQPPMAYTPYMTLTITSCTGCSLTQSLETRRYTPNASRRQQFEREKARTS